MTATRKPPKAKLRKPKLQNRPMEAFTVGHWRKWSENLILDTGEPWEIEDFQVEVMRPILEGVKEVWGILPEGSSKTTMMAGYALYHCSYTPAPWVPVAASSRDQAEILARQAYSIIRATPGMEAFSKKGPGRFKIFEGYREIYSVRTGGRGIKVYAADTITGDGVIPTLCLCDEGHRWPDLALYRLWKGKLNKRKGQIVMISTAGEPGGEFEETRDMIRDQAETRTLTGSHLYAAGALNDRGVPNIVMNEWSVQDPADISNMHKVKEANPFSGITADTLLEEFNSPTTDIGDWKRLKCNIPSRTVLAAITEQEWDAARVDAIIPTEAHIDVGVDVAWKHDTFAIAPIWQAEEYNLLGDPCILVPPRDGSTLKPDDVKIAFTELMERFTIDAAVIDMERAEDIAAWLQDECAVEVIDRSQGNAMAIEDYDAFMKGLRTGKLKHTGDAGLRRHVMNAIARNLPASKRRFDRPSQSRARKRQTVRVIDALTAAAMVNQYVGIDEGGNEPLIAWR